MPRGDASSWHGDLEDGFFRVDALRAVSEQDDPNSVSLTASAKTVTDLCASTIQRQTSPDGTPELYAFSAMREGDSADATMAFAFDPNGPLVTRLVASGRGSRMRPLSGQHSRKRPMPMTSQRFLPCPG